MTEILDAGAWASSRYDTSEMKDALRKAFIRDRMDSIELRNSKRESQFLAATASWGVEQGLLEVHPVAGFDEQDSGSVRLTLTDAGRAEFGL